MLDSLKIGMYRGLKDLYLSEFKRINLFVGNNNSGKTSVLESIIMCGLFSDTKLLLDTISSRYPVPSADFLQCMFPVDGEKIVCLNAKLSDANHYIHTHIRYDDILRFKLDNEDGEFKNVFNLIFNYNYNYHYEDDSCIDKEEINSEEAQEFQHQIFVSFVEDEKGYRIAVNERGEPEKHPRILCNFVSFSRFDRSTKWADYVDKLLESNRREELIDVLRIFDPDVTNFEVVGTNRMVKIFSKERESSLSLYDYGNGMYKSFLIAVLALLSKDGILLIDEIEAGIHNKALGKMLDYLLQICKVNNIQLFLTTHSLETIDTILTNESYANDIAVYHLKASSASSPSSSARRYSGEKLKKLRDSIGFDVR